MTLGWGRLTSTTTTCIMCSMTNIAGKRLTLFLNPSILKHARAEAIVEEITLTKLVEKALIAYLPAEIVLKKEAL